MESEKILQEAKELKDYLVKIRRTLHAAPETGFSLDNTKKLVTKELQAMGYETKSCGKCGITALVGNKDKESDRVFLIRSDMDALPIKEETGIDFASDNGNMHACGHDFHTTMLLGAAKLLKLHESEINGRIKLMFQPAEEIFQGSQDMIDDGILENPKVDAGMMIHVMVGMPMSVGTAVIASEGVSAPAADYFEIKVQGLGCHGSMPNTGVDPMIIAAHILLGLQEIQTRELSIQDKVVVTVGNIYGGNASNVIPDMVTLAGTIRCFDEDVRALVKKRMEEISSGIASTFRGKAWVEFGSGCPTLVNDGSVLSCVADSCKELLGDKGAFTAAELSKGSASSQSGGAEDFAYISHKIPTAMVALAAGGPKEGCTFPLHHPKVRFDEEALCYGAAIYAYSAIKWLEQ